MYKELYLIKIGTVYTDNGGYEDLRDDDVLTIPVSNYVESQKILFHYLENYTDREINKRTIIWLEVYNLLEKLSDVYDFILCEYIKGLYFYSYCGITKEDTCISLSHGNDQPARNIYHNWSCVLHYKPKNKENEYKQALMEYRLQKNDKTY